MTRSSRLPLLKRLQQGGELDHDGLDKAAVVEASAQAGVLLCVADCDRARSRSAVLRAIVRAVDFPEFFGSDMDALYDCLCDTVLDHKVGIVLWLYKLHSGDPALADDAARVASVCGDIAVFARENGRLFTYVIEHAGKHPEAIPGVAAPLYGPLG